MKYRLIKKYPGSPELGTILQEKGKNSWHTIDNRTIYNGLLPQKYPEFWEKVVEKDYEILSFSHSRGLTTLRDSGYYVNGQYLPSDCYNGKGATLNEILNKEEYCDYKIHSVRRLSDGEIFTVGDRVKFQGNGYSDITTIFKFEFVNDKIHAHSGSISFHINFIHHIKKPLFTTEDGVELFEGDKYYRLDTNFTIAPLAMIMGKRFNNSYAGAKFFSTRKSAEEYILMNKPCLSINDVIFSFNTLKLKELVKQKIKKDEENNL